MVPEPMDLHSALLERIVLRLRAEEPALEAVLLAGSFARSEGDAFSDVDVVALTGAPPQRSETAWFDRNQHQRLIHISVEYDLLAEWSDTSGQLWALGFPVVDPHKVIWATNVALRLIGPNPSLSSPPGPADLEDFVELYMKVRRADRAGDTPALRWASRSLAEHAPALIRDFNPEQVVRTPLEAITAATLLAAAPPHYREDFETCFGLTCATATEVAASAHRMAFEMLAFLRRQWSDAEIEPGEFAAFLMNGTIEAYIRT